VSGEKNPTGKIIATLEVSPHVEKMKREYLHGLPFFMVRAKRKGGG
jgi:hypothetical protein